MRPAFPIASRIACLIAAAVAVLVLVGWIAGLPVLTSIVPGWSTMTMNTAACFFLTAVAMCLAGPDTTPGRLVSLAASALVLGFTGLTLVQYFGGWDFGIDQLLWRESAGSNALFPGRMAPNSAVAFLLLHIALRLLPAARHHGRIAVAGTLAGIVALIGAYEVVGYLALFTIGHGWGEQTTMSVHTGALFLLLGAVWVANAWRTAGATGIVWRSLTAVFALGLAILISIAIYSYKSFAEYQSTGDRLRHTHEVQAMVRGIGELLVEGELAMRDFAMAGEENLVGTMETRLADAWAGVAELRQLTAMEPSQRQQLDRLEPLIRAQGQFASEVVEERRARGAAAAIALMQAGRGLAIKAQVEEVLAAMDHEEDHFLERRQQGLEKASARLPYILPIGTFLGVAILLTAFVFLNAEVVERRRVETLLRESDASFRHASETQAATLNALPAHIALLDSHGVIVAVNEAWKRFGEANLLHSQDFCVGSNYLEVCEQAHGDCSDEADIAANGIRSILHGNQQEFSLEYPCHSPDEKRWFRLMVTPVVEDRREGVVVMHINVTERRLAEERLLRLNRLHIVLSKISETVVRAQSRQELFETACRLLVEDGHLRLAFIAEADPSGKSLRKLAGAGEGQTLLESAMATLTDEERKRGIIATALRTGAPDVINDIANDPRMARWREAVVAAGFCANAAFPIKPGGETVAALVLCAGEVNYFEDDEIRLMTAVAGDIAFALEVQEKKAQNLQAQEALRMQAHTLDHIGQAVIATDTAGVIFYANRAASELYGWPIDEMKGSSVLEVTVPQASREQGEAIMHQLQKGENWTGEFFVQTRAGRVFPALVTDSPLLNEKGALVGIVGISTDITERRQTERTQRQLAEQLATERARLLEAQTVAHLGSWETDIASLEVTWSPEMYAIYEQNLESYRPTYESIQASVHPDDRARIDEAFRTALETPGEYAIEHRLLFADGRVKHVEERWRTIYDAEGKPVRATGVCHDITERKIAVEQLAAERVRLLEAQAVSHVGSWETDLATMEVTASPETYRIFELDTDSAMAHEGFIALVHPEDREAVATGFAESVERSSPAEIQHRILFPDGRVKYVEVRWRIVRDAAGKPVRAIGSTHDITERHLASVALRRADESLRMTLEGMTEAFITVDREWQFTYLNAEAERLVQQPRAALLGKNLWELFPPLLGTDFETHYRRAMEENVAVSFEGLFAPLGLWVEERVFPSSEGLAIYMRDITELRGQREALRASEREFHTLAESMPQIVWAADTEGRATYLNQKWVDYTGFTIEESLGDGFYGAFHPDDRQRTGEAWARTLAGEGDFTIELRIRAADGSYRWFLNRASPQRDEHGQVVKWFGTCTDIHDLKMADLEISRTNRALKMLGSCNEALIHAEDEAQLLHEVCKIAVDVGGYKMVWIGYPQQDEAGSIKVMASCGDSTGYLERLKISWHDDAPAGHGPGGRVLRSGQAVLVRDVTTDPFFTHLASALEFGFRSVIALPMRLEGRTFGALFLYAPTVSEITETELKLLQELADDLAFGIGNLRSRNERAKLQSIVVKVAGAVSAATGAEFFEQLARNMAEALGAQASFVARLLPGEPATARSIAGVIDGQAAAPLEFLIADSPCADQLEESCVAEDVAGCFPNAPEFAAIGAQGFVGRWLHNSAGEQIGLIFVLFREPLVETEFISSTLRIFAARAASEVERQQSEMQLREQAALLDAAHEAIYVKSIDDGVLYWNKGAERLYGWTAEEVVGEHISERLYANPEKIADAREKVIANGYWEGEVEKRTKDGRILIAEVSWTLMRDATGAPKSILAINSDVTERKHLEQQFLRAQRMESIGTLAGGIAHDLNNALSPVILSLDILKRKFPDQKSQDLLHVLSVSAQRGADMVQQVLSFARGVEGQRIEVQVRHLLDDVEKISRDTFPKNIVIETSAPTDLWTVFGDATQLHQVLINLCVNARDAMPDGGRLKISAENREIDAHYAGLNSESKPGPYVFLQVEDTGTGIPAEIIEKLFDPFFTTKEIGKGTGLGLSSSLAIVRSHGGFIRVTSEIGKGTTFTVSLPAGTATVAETVKHPPVNLPRGQGETVLVVDDESSVRLITKQTLEAFGYQVILANDGADAVAIFASRQQEIDVVLTDMMMPIMDGPSAIRVLLSMDPAVRVIAASGLAAGGNIAQIASLGVKHFLPKPYSAETLLKTLQEILRVA